MDKKPTRQFIDRAIDVIIDGIRVKITELSSNCQCTGMVKLVVISGLAHHVYDDAIS